MEKNFSASDVVVSSRIRLARNFEDLPSPAKLRDERAFDVQKQVFEDVSIELNAIKKSGFTKSAFNLLTLKSVSTNNVLIKYYVLLSVPAMILLIFSLCLNATKAYIIVRVKEYQSGMLKNGP